MVLSELNALASLIGPYGIKTLNDHLSEYTWEMIQELFEKTNKEQEILIQIQEVSRSSTWDDNDIGQYIQPLRCRAKYRNYGTNRGWWDIPHHSPDVERGG